MSPKYHLTNEEQAAYFFELAVKREVLFDYLNK